MDSKELSAFLNKARDAYYEGAPIVSDREFDNLEAELEKIDPTNTYFKKVGPSEKTEQGKIKHDVLMKSLNKVTNEGDLTTWVNERFVDSSIDILVEPKIDGVSITIKYDNGTIQYVATRGDGSEGQDVSFIGDYIEDIPIQIPDKESIEIRGEAYLPRDTDYKKDKEHKSLRNIAAGIINRKDNQEDAQYLKFVAYDVIDKEFDTEEDKIAYLNRTMPDVVSYEKVTNVEEIVAVWEEYNERKREALNYEVDGLVIKINDSSLQKRFEGDAPHHPGNAVAWKFPPEQKETVIERVEWTVGEKGKVTPIAYFNPVIIGNKTITKATLHNRKRVEELQLELGDKIIVSLHGDVIPGVDANLSKNIKIETNN
jgi:DNA ligase (NAD+)